MGHQQAIIACILERTSSDEGHNTYEHVHVE